ncbi:unnamed protein product [Polarella glacialis]|uniref:Uncharacterized protein n=1 Tax=Polarella glacialis TaxID=89957 RepID=A0A813FLR2_POLGL|nr:unnamed protein product [Polarella glacialis]
MSKKIQKAKASEAVKVTDGEPSVQKLKNPKKVEKPAKAGVLSLSKVKQFLPEALDVSRLAKASVGDDDDDDDGPPVEVSTNRAKEGADDEGDSPPDEVTHLPKTRRGRRKGAAADGLDEAASSGTQSGKKAKFAWEEPENQALFETLKAEDELRRRRNLGSSRVEKNGITLVRDGVTQASGDAAASEFWKQEMFVRRKRKRSVDDRLDRNVLGRGALPARLLRSGTGVAHGEKQEEVKHHRDVSFVTCH